MMKKEKPEIVLLNEINLCLQGQISAEEKRILLSAKEDLEKNRYFLAITGSLQAGLTPLAIRQELSDGGRKIYRLLLDLKFASQRRLGIGLATIFGG